MSLFGEHPDWMTGKMVNKPRKSKVLRDETWYELFQAAEAAFYSSGISDDQRARVAKLVDNLRQKGATATNLAVRMERYGELFKGRVVCTLPAILNNWDTCKPLKRTTPTPEESWAARQEVKRQEEEAARIADAPFIAARKIVEAADPEQVWVVYRWWQESTPRLRKWVSKPTDAGCVIEIANELRARNAIER